MKKAQNPFVIENLPLFFVFVFKIGNKFPPCLKSKQYVGTNKHYQGEKFYNNNKKRERRQGEKPKFDKTREKQNSSKMAFRNAPRNEEERWWEKLSTTTFFKRKKKESD